jgi:hypothetical protein
MTAKMMFRPESCRAAAEEARKALAAGRVAERIRRKDHTLWKPEPNEIANRLGWLDSPQTMQGCLAGIASVVEGVRADGFNFALLLGMGGPASRRRCLGKSSVRPMAFSTSPYWTARTRGRFSPAPSGLT